MLSSTRYFALSAQRYSRATRAVNGKGKRFYSMPTEANVCRYTEHGEPIKVLKRVKEKLPALGKHDVMVKMHFAPINPSDFNMIEGSYAILPKLPAVGGNEGVGEILAVGDLVRDLKPQDLVLPAKPGFGTWRDYAVCPSTSMLKLPENAKDVKKEYLASLSVNPCTALRLLEDFVNLKEGDVIVQNGANSQVGMCVIQLAHARGIKTINIIREGCENYESTVEHLKSYGADIVLDSGYFRTPEFKRLVTDIPKPKLALNCVGGTVATEMVRKLAPGGTMVTYGNMSRRPVTVPTSQFIFKDVTLKGFWLSKWIEEHSVEERLDMFNKVIEMMKIKTPGEGLRLWTETQKFSKFEDAIQAPEDSLKRRSGEDIRRKIQMNLQL